MVIAASLVGGLALGCKPAADETVAKLPAALQSNQIDQLPEDFEGRALVDFEGKVHLIGWEVEPADQVNRGGKLSVKLYWKRVAPLSPGWRLFTHVLDRRGNMIANADNVGPLRTLTTTDGVEDQTWPPAKWKPGKIYVDEQQVDVPALDTPFVTLTVGIWRYVQPEAVTVNADGGTEERQPPPVDMRLSIVSGRSDGNHRAVIATIPTDYTPPPPVTADEPSP